MRKPKLAFVLVSIVAAMICAAAASHAHAASGQTALGTAQDPMTAAADRLEHLAAVRFGALSAAERMAVRAAPQRELKWLGPGGRAGSAGNDVAQAEKWGPERSVRADIVRWLYSDPQASPLMDQSGLGIAAARILGRLDFSFLKIDKPITLLQCYIPDGVDASNSNLRALDLRGSRTGPVSADLGTIEGDLDLQFGVYAG